MLYTDRDCSTVHQLVQGSRLCCISPDVVSLLFLVDIQETIRQRSSYEPAHLVVHDARVQTHISCPLQNAADGLDEQLTDADTRSRVLERDGMDSGNGVQGDMLEPSPSNNDVVTNSCS